MYAHISYECTSTMLILCRCMNKLIELVSPLAHWPTQLACMLAWPHSSNLSFIIVYKAVEDKAWIINTGWIWLTKKSCRWTDTNRKCGMMPFSSGSHIAIWSVACLYVISTCLYLCFCTGKEIGIDIEPMDTIVNHRLWDFLLPARRSRKTLRPWTLLWISSFWVFLCQQEDVRETSSQPILI